VNATHSIRERLAAGPIRGLGCSNEIVAEATNAPELIGELVDALRDQRPVVTIRAANALQKVQRAQPDLVAKYSHKLVRAALGCEDLRTRWNLVEVVGGLHLRGTDRALAIDLMFEALGSNSGFLRAFAITGLAEYAREDADLRKRVRTIVEKALEDSSAAVRARARKLVPKL
jgi:hypothetical protein